MTEQVLENLEPYYKALSFNYLAIVGNSRTGKTTLAKTILNSLPQENLTVFVCDPNRQYADFTTSDKAVYVAPGELKDSINTIGKKLLLQRQKGVLVIEDLHLTIQRITETLGYSEKKAKQLIALLLENLGKYDVKVIAIMHDIDKDLIGKFDVKVFFQTPLNAYQVKKYSQELGFSLSDVPLMPRFAYMIKTLDSVTHGHVDPLESHAAIERDKGFMVKELLSNCHSLPEKIIVLRLHVGLANPQIAHELNIQTSTVKEIVSKLRHRGLAIPDARKTLRLEKLAF